jgi:hypothetical protein
VARAGAWCTVRAPCFFCLALPVFLLCSVVSFYSGERERVGQYQSERGKGVVLPIVGHLGTVQLV